MKDHVQKLADKAKKSVPHGLTPDKWIEVYNQKFAKLIVKECLFKANGAKIRGDSIDELIIRIKEDFGVED